MIKVNWKRKERMRVIKNLEDLPESQKVECEVVDGEEFFKNKTNG